MLFVQAKLTLEVNCGKDTGDFNGKIEYLMDYESHQQVHQHLNIATIMSSSHMALPCQGHLEVALHVIWYASIHYNLRSFMDPMYLDINATQFPVSD